MIRYIDIETGPLPEDHIRQFEPEFEANKSLKDPDKIAADIAKKRAEWYERAALSAITGQIIAVGILSDELGFQVLEGKETEILEGMADLINTGAQGARYRIVGFNILGFDLPFIIRRAWAQKVKMPLMRSGRFWQPWIIDLRDVWGCGEHQPHGSLDTVARFLGVGSKNGHGADFHRLYSAPSTRTQALEYLKNDLLLTRNVALSLGAC